MKKIIISLLLLSVMLCGCRQTSYLNSSESADITTESTSEEPKEGYALGYVQVGGAVKNPGVYEIGRDTRLFMIIEAAGGLTEEADISSLNQARALKDGESIYIMTAEEAKHALETMETNDSADGKVNINTADINLLMTLPGVGESKAKDIISYRETNGPFSSIEEIMEISGIKEGVYNKIKDNIKV